MWDLIVSVPDLYLFFTLNTIICLKYFECIIYKNQN